MKEAPISEARAEFARAFERAKTISGDKRQWLRGHAVHRKDPMIIQPCCWGYMKSFNVLAGMGSAMVSCVPDVARSVMVDGLFNAYRKGFMALLDEQAIAKQDVIQEAKQGCCWW